jgi:hypothetical protein
MTLLLTCGSIGVCASSFTRTVYGILDVDLADLRIARLCMYGICRYFLCPSIYNEVLHILYLRRNKAQRSGGYTTFGGVPGGLYSIPRSRKSLCQQKMKDSRVYRSLRITEQSHTLWDYNGTTRFQNPTQDSFLASRFVRYR